MKKFLLSLITLLTLTGISFAGSLQFTWDAPVTNADGTPITYFAGKYRMYTKTSATGTYSTYIEVTNTAATVTATIPGLLDDTQYWSVVTAVNTLGNESGYSNEVSKRTAIVVPGKPGTYR